MTEEHKLEDLFFMSKALKQALTDGIENWAQDTDKRSAWLETEPLAWHSIAGTMLVGLFSYTEGRAGKAWWKRLRSPTAKRDLRILWKARNQFVHADSKLVQNKWSSILDVQEFQNYCDELSAGNLKDDKGNKYPVYMTYEKGQILFNKDAINHFSSLFEVAFQASRLGRL